MLLEVPVYSVDSAIKAQSGGADRVELCANMLEGGTTPSQGAVELALDKLDIPVHVMIRPRGGDFLYDDLEYLTMIMDVTHAKLNGAAGIVFGILKPDGEIDSERCRELIAMASPMQVTFHRAFDMARDPWSALEDLKEIGVHRVLTSGQAPSAMEGVRLIADLIKNAGDRIIVMPGGGIKAEQVAEIVRISGAQEIHVSARKKTSSQMKYKKQGLRMSGVEEKSEFENWGVDLNLVSAIKASLNDPGNG